VSEGEAKDEELQFALERGGVGVGEVAKEQGQA
jgi:hypothetical protein